MRWWRSALLCVLSSVALAAAHADGAADLVFFSGDLMSGRNYGGVGWLHATSGLDSSGPVLAAELGSDPLGWSDGQATAGWRLAENHAWITFLAGVEIDPRNAPAFHPLAVADLWWEPAPAWMVAAQIQATPAYASWRIAVGLKPQENWPWLGPEAGSNAGEPRVGLHATGLSLPGGVEARVSAGVSWRCGRPGPYGELSVWRRF